jgi:hypothetical protein
MATGQQDIWTKQVPEPGQGGEYHTCPPGNHPGVIVGIFDVGTHSVKNPDGEYKDLHQLILIFELLKKNPKGEPFLLYRRYTWSLHKKANFAKDVAAVIGRTLNPKDSFSPLSLLGIPVLVSVTNNEGKEGKVYHEVTGLGQFPEGMPSIPSPIHKPVSWSVRSSQPFPEGDWLPWVYGQSIGEIASESAEARAAGRSHSSASSNGNPQGGPVPQSGKALFAWVQSRIDMPELLKYLNSWARLQDLPARIVDWDKDEVSRGYAECCRKLGLPVSTELAEPAGSEGDPDIPF